MRAPAQGSRFTRTPISPRSDSGVPSDDCSLKNPIDDTDLYQKVFPVLLLSGALIPTLSYAVRLPIANGVTVYSRNASRPRSSSAKLTPVDSLSEHFEVVGISKAARADQDIHSTPSCAPAYLHFPQYPQTVA